MTKRASDTVQDVGDGPADCGANAVEYSVQTPVLEPTVIAIETLRKRADFLRTATARRAGTASFLLQARARGDDTPAMRIGFTASKKIGNAVLRNRAKRRMRAAIRAVLPLHGQSGWDYVLVAKPGATVARVFTDMLADLARAFDQIHQMPRPKDGPGI